ncbi:HAD family hydrolase [Oryzibacter oryziterrae]|uniref:HAD family hydrolase n=1 Tax=Oryzibacter oryziterrae TaxID=2766474 RepID=UPI001F38EA9C|nr:HAD family hydrolase [Oryzibacter oryziterrae]
MTDDIKGVLFDKDGTLIDYHLTWGPMNRKAALLAAAGDTALASVLLDLGGMDETTGITRSNSLLAAGNTREIAEAWVEAGSPVAPDTLVVELDDLFTRSATSSVPLTDLAALFSRLKSEGLRIGIASSDSEGAIRTMLAHFGLTDLVDFVAGYDSGHGVKPGPGMVQAFAAALAIPPEEIAVVGDNPHDMEMGRSAGAGVRVAVLSGTSSRDVLQHLAHAVLPDIGHLSRPALVALRLQG